jgi:two-component system phosphate regulon sensor histidine kinase PhoR
MIDSILRNELSCFEPNKDYYYAIIDTLQDKIIYTDPDTDIDINKLLSAEHRISLSTISSNENLFLSVFFPKEKKLIVRRMALWVLILSGSFLLLVIACFLFIIFTIIHQKKISEMKNDFVNNMTHEFKTPISTISVASEMLMKPAVSDQPDKIHKYANIIYDENLRLRNQVEQVLQISILDKNELKIQPAEIDIHLIIENSVDIFNMIVREKKGEIVSELNAVNSVIVVDELHFINVITNLLDNAIKYTDNNPKIKITTMNENDGITIRIEDNGIGIDPPNQKHIYKKFFRVHTGDIHNVKGFGLGLFYVKSVMDAHKGSIRLIKSELCKGSLFELHFPSNFNKNQSK